MCTFLAPTNIGEMANSAGIPETRLKAGWYVSVQGGSTPGGGALVESITAGLVTATRDPGRKHNGRSCYESPE